MEQQIREKMGKPGSVDDAVLATRLNKLENKLAQLASQASATQSKADECMERLSKSAQDSKVTQETIQAEKAVTLQMHESLKARCDILADSI